MPGTLVCKLARFRNARSVLEHNLADLLGGAVEVLIIVNSEFFLFAGNHGFGNVRLGALESHHDRFGQADFLMGVDNGLRQLVAAENATKDIDEDGLHLLVCLEQLEGLNQCLALCAATYIQEVSGLAAILGKDVHRSHCKPGTVNEATDVAADVDVVEVVLLGFSFEIIQLGLIFRISNFLLAVGCIVVDRDLAVGSEHLLVLREHKGVDFNHVAIPGHETLVNPCEHIDHLVSLILQSKILGGLHQQFALGALLDVHLQLENLLGVGVCNVLNRHATCWAVDKRWAARLAVEGE